MEDVIDFFCVSIFIIDYLLRGITMLSSLMGIAVIALPAGIITAGYGEELRKEKLAKSGAGIEKQLMEHGFSSLKHGETKEAKTKEDTAE